MRDILFRGKTEKGEWVYGFLLFDAEQNEAYIAEYFEDKAAYLKKVIPETVGQYTGLTDKNGKRIFEGDVVRYIAQRTGRTILYGIEWQEEMSRFEMKTINDGMKLHEWLERSKANYCYEVIGNIHDNPELLKGGDSDA